MFWGGSKSAKGGPNPLADMDRGVQIRCDTDTKTISDRASVHKGITNFGAVFTTERRCAASILKVNRHVSDRFGPFLFTLCRRVFHVGTKSGSV